MIPVATFDEALKALQDIGGEPVDGRAQGRGLTTASRRQQRAAVDGALRGTFAHYD